MLEHLRGMFADLMVAFGFAGLCGGLNYLLKVEEGKEFSWTELILHTVISGVCGLGTFVILRHLAGFEPDVCGAFCGVAGWMGTRLLRIIECRFTKRMIGLEDSEEK